MVFVRFRPTGCLQGLGLKQKPQVMLLHWGQETARSRHWCSYISCHPTYLLEVCFIVLHVLPYPVSASWKPLRQSIGLHNYTTHGPACWLLKPSKCRDMPIIWSVWFFEFQIPESNAFLAPPRLVPKSFCPRFGQIVCYGQSIGSVPSVPHPRVEAVLEEDILRKSTPGCVDGMWIRIGIVHMIPWTSHMVGSAVWHG